MYEQYSEQLEEIENPVELFFALMGIAIADFMFGALEQYMNATSIVQKAPGGAEYD